MVNGQVLIEFPYNTGPYDSISAQVEIRNTQVSLETLFLTGGIHLRQEEETWDHPQPSCDRLFLFMDEHADLETDKGQVELRQGIINLLPETYSFKVTYSAGSRLCWFHLRNLDMIKLPFFRHAKQILQLEDEGLFSMITESAETGSSLQTKNLVFGAVLSIAESLSEITPYKSLASGRFRELFDFLEHELTPYTRIDDLADVMNMSRSALSKGFQRAAGIPLKTYITRLIMDRAKQNLLNTDLTVEEVAFETGFNDPYYFNRAFKKHTGVCPGKFRKQNREPFLKRET